jgi:hypothetical protein
MIGLIDTLYIHRTLDYRQYNTIAILPTLQFTVAHALGFSVFTSPILATDFITVSLSLQITHGILCSQPNSFLAIILQLQIPKTRLRSLPSSYPGRLASRNSTELFYSRLPLLYSAVCCLTLPYNHFARTMQKTQPYCLGDVSTDPLHSNRRPILARVGTPGNAFNESLPSNGYARHNIIFIVM